MEEAVNTAAQSSPSELMAHFQASLAVTTADDLTAKVLLAISCIEGGTSIAGSVSFARKAKSLVQRWLATPVDCMSPGENALQTNDIIIERVLEVYPTDISDPLPRIFVLLPSRVPVRQPGTSTSRTLGYNSLRKEDRHHMT